MIVEFQIKGTVFSGKVIDRGFYKVDVPESYEVRIGNLINTVFVPVSECAVIE